MGAFDFIKSELTDIISPLLEGQRRLFGNSEIDMNSACVSIVERYRNEGIIEEYVGAGLEDRMRIASSFYNEVSDAMGIDADFSFVPMPYLMEGGYNPSNNSIELNINSLENPNCASLFNTILHESRHAFQHKAVANPYSVSVDNNIIETWRQNFDNYISPWLDYEAYREQPVENDAFDYADSIFPEDNDDRILAQVKSEQDACHEKNNQEDINRIYDQIDNPII